MNINDLKSIKVIFSTLILLILWSYKSFGQSEKYASYMYVDQNATFQGKDLLYFRDSFIMSKLIYPDSAKINHIERRVIVQFVIGTLGNVDTVVVLRSLDKECDDEVVKIIKSSSGMWTPAKSNKKNVKQQFTIPVIFSLSEKKEPPKKKRSKLFW